MNNQFWLSSQSKPDFLAVRLDELRMAISTRDPGQLTQDTDTRYRSHSESNGEFRLRFWDQSIVLSFPELVAQENQSGKKLSDSSQALLLYYFSTCDGTKPSGQWISFSELPDGRFYNQAFQGYTGGKLGHTFQNEIDHFCQAAENLGGKRVYLLGDAAYEFIVLALVSLLVVAWQGDEDFNATYQVLFDSAVGHHLPTDACAITGSILTGRLIIQLERMNENRN
jgi:hypothetical protein